MYICELNIKEPSKRRTWIESVYNICLKNLLPSWEFLFWMLSLRGRYLLFTHFYVRTFRCIDSTRIIYFIQNKRTTIFICLSLIRRLSMWRGVISKSDFSLSTSFKGITMSLLMVFALFLGTSAYFLTEHFIWVFSTGWVVWTSEILWKYL